MNVHGAVAWVPYRSNLRLKMIAVGEILPELTDIFIHSVGVERFALLRDFFEKVLLGRGSSLERKVSRGLFALRSRRFHRLRSATPLHIMPKFQSEAILVGLIDAANQKILYRRVAGDPGLCARSGQVLRINEVEVGGDVLADGQLGAEILV